MTTWQAHSIYQYKSIRTKILKCNADIFFNRQCLTKNIVPKYANTKVPITSKAPHTTQKRICSIRIKDEIKFLYMKKDKLDKQLYQIHLRVAQGWGNSWHTIRNSIYEAINKNMDRKYHIIKQKLSKLEHTQVSTRKCLKTFNP